jgi:uncharacterized protein YecE (DUF72 family)
MMASVCIGTSGYVYRHWRNGVFYPQGLRHRDELTYYSGVFRTVELNSPFYRVPTPETFARWRDATPDDFTFAVKLSRGITHYRRLRDVSALLDEFLDRAGVLGPKLGPLLVQLPPDFKRDTARLEEFLATIPSRLRWVIEFRHPSWQSTDVYGIMARYGAALCVPIGGVVKADLVTTAPFTYLRIHRGPNRRGYMGRDGLRPWAARIRALTRAGKDVYVYFNNDTAGHAVRDAGLLQDLLGGRSS